MKNKFGLNILYRATYIYLALPVVVFCATWFNLPLALILCFISLLGIYKVCQDRRDNENAFSINGKMFTVAVICSIIWCFFAGIGYFYYQSWDYHFRNAIFRDLINYEWPVFYTKADTPLVYYMGFWLIPAGLSKLTSFFVSHPETNFLIANIYLFFYAAIGVSLIFLHLIATIKTHSLKKILIAVVIFILFSGLDIIGNLFYSFSGYFDYHLEWWASFMQYSSITTNMFWIFNQFIPIALVIFLIYNERKIQNFGFIFALSLFFAPYPAIGVGIIMSTYTLQQFFMSAQKKGFIFDILFSVPNIIGILGIMPIVALYFATNSEAINKWYNIFDYTDMATLFVFLVLEFLLYAILIFKYYKKDVFFLTTVVLLCLIPFFRFDQQNNFCMRVSIPFLTMLALLCIQFLFIKFNDRKAYLSKILLILLLIIGAATPLMEFYRGLYYVNEAKKINLVKDDIYTLDQKHVAMPDFGFQANHQFSAKFYQTDIFWQYLAKKRAY